MLDEPKRTGPVTIEELSEIAEAAFRNAREENRRLGIPNGFERDGKLLWEFPDGTITDVNPFANETPVAREEEPRDAKKGR